MAKHTLYTLENYAKCIYCLYDLNRSTQRILSHTELSTLGTWIKRLRYNYYIIISSTHTFFGIWNSIYLNMCSISYILRENTSIKLMTHGQEICASFWASFYIYVLMSNIRAKWRQHIITETCLKTCANLLPVCHQL